MGILTILNEQAEMVCDELLKAKREAREGRGMAAAYQQGRAEELEKWLHSLEDLIEKIIDKKGDAKK